MLRIPARGCWCGRAMGTHGAGGFGTGRSYPPVLCIRVTKWWGFYEAGTVSDNYKWKSLGDLAQEYCWRKRAVRGGGGTLGTGWACWVQACKEWKCFVEGLFQWKMGLQIQSKILMENEKKKTNKANLRVLHAFQFLAVTFLDLEKKYMHLKSHIWPLFWKKLPMTCWKMNY